LWTNLPDDHFVPGDNMSRIHGQRAKIKTVRPRLEALEDRVVPTTVSWVSPTSGAWTTATNWSTGMVPAAGDDVVINKPAAVTVTLAASTTIHSLSLTVATLNVTSGTLTVAADSSNAGSLQVQPGAHVTFAGNYAQSAAGSLSLPAAGLSTGVGTNLLTNSGFESPAMTTITPGGWASWGTSYLSGQYAHTGGQSLQAYGPNSGVLESFAVTPGASYTGTVYAMTPATNPLTGPEGGFLEVIFYDASGNQITPYSPPYSVNILSSTSATGGPIAGSIGNQGWNLFSNTEVAPSNAATVDFILETGAYTGNSGTAGGAVFWDDPQFGPTGGTNLLTNSGFESPSVTTTVPSGWPSWGTSYLSSQHAHTGAQSLQESGPNSGVLESFAVTPGVSYTGTVYAMTPSTNRLTGPEGGFLQVIFYDASGNQISPYSPPNSVTILNSNSATGGPIAGSVGNQGWNYFSTTAVAPANAAKVNFVLETGAYTGLPGTAGGAVFWDDPQFGPTAANAASVNAASMTNNGTISIGAGDKLGVNGTFTQTSSGTLAVQLGGPPASGLYGALSATGAATLAGTLQATLVNGYTPAVSDGFNVLTYPSVAGTFTTYQLPSGPSYNFAAAINPTYVGLAAVPAQLSTTVNTGTVVGPVATNMLGVNLAWWDDKLTTSQTQQMVQAAGLAAFRFPGGSSSDDYHFNVSNNFNDSVANTIPQFAKFIESVGGTGLVTLDYGSGSPQEGAAELAYLEGSPTDTTVIGTGLEWNDSTNQWNQINWQTVGYWANLRAATPLAHDDGYNFLRINHPAAFTGITEWEVGNEEYGSWETDHHGTAGPGGISTGAQHDPATYAAFAHAFAGYAAEIDSGISIGIDSGDPGASYNNWIKNVLTQGQAIGFVPGFISDHSYMQGPGQESDTTLLLHTVSDPSSVLDWSTRHADYQTLLQTTLGSQASGVQVMGTEFNSVYTNPGKQSTSLVNGLFIADSIGSLLDSGYTGGFVWDLRNGWDTTQNNSPSLYGWRQGGDYGLLGDPNTSTPPSTGPYVPYPNYFAEQLASKIVLTGGQVVSASSNYQDLTAYAVLEVNGHLELLVINKNPYANLNEQFTLQGFTPNGHAQVWQYGEAQDYAQSQTTDGSAALADLTTTLTLNGSSFNYTFPAYSMTVLDLTPSMAATHFTVSAPASATAGQAFSITVMAQDVSNQTAAYTGTIHFTSSDMGAGVSLPADYTFTVADAGVHTFSGVTLVTAGNQTLTATDTVNASITGTSNNILVNAAAATHFAVSAPASATAGLAFSFTVTTLDQFNNTATGYGGTVHFTSTDGGAILPADSTLTSGTASFSATLVTTGSQTIIATDTVNASITGTSNTVLVSAAAATHFSVSAPASAPAGSAFNFTVTALDAFNNTATGYGGTVHFTSTDSSATLPPDSTFSNGTGSFSATLRTAGNQTLTATDTLNSSTYGMSNTILVNAATATSFVVAGYPSPVTAGTANSFTVTAKDAFGNRAAGYTGTVHFTNTDPKAVLPANYTFATPDAGMHMFSATFRTATLPPGSQSITATDTRTSSIYGTQSGIVVNAAATNHLVVSRFPSKTTAGAAQGFRVTAQDMFGNTTTGFTDTVSFSSSDASAFLPGPYTFTTTDAGIHNFTATLVTAGTQSITARDSINAAVASGTQTGIVVTPAAANHLQVAGFPSSVIAGTAHTFTVTALDPYGNVATGYLGTVKFMSSDTMAMLPANYTFTSGDAGMHAMFSATLNTSGTQSIMATDTVNSGVTGMDAGISVVSTQPTASITGPPANSAGSNGVPGQPLSFTLSATESGLSPETVYTYNVQWGDGSPMQTFMGPSGTLVTHSFPTSIGYTISAMATDPSGNGSLPATTSVSLTTLALEPDPANSSQTALYVGGTTGADTIAITPAVRTVNGNLDYGVKVGMNMVSYGSFFSISRVVVYGQAGADIIKTAAQTINGVSTNVSVPVMFFSGSDNDILNLTGSGSNIGTVAPNNVLVGGGGTDRLIGGQGRDILIGGAGASRLDAGSGGDVLIGGTTDYDSNAKALAALLDEWTSSNDYTTRMAHLMGTMSGGLNGPYFLNPSIANGTVTVHDNHLADNLYGGAGMDWFFAGMMDMFFNKTTGEMVTQI
jgi:hypothetical protein